MMCPICDGYGWLMDGDGSDRDRIDCPACGATGHQRLICKHCKHPAERFGPVGMWQHCPDHEGGSLTHEWVESHPPDPCPVCGQHGHAMSAESGPGPLCSPLRDVSGDFEGATYYDCEDSEQLSYTDPDEAIEYALDALDEDPAELEIVAYKRVVLDLDAIAENVLELALERLDEVLGDPGGDPCEATTAQKEADRVFAAAIAADYTPWQCEPCGRATVDVAAWRKAEGLPRVQP